MWCPNREASTRIADHFPRYVPLWRGRKRRNRRSVRHCLTTTEHRTHKKVRKINIAFVFEFALRFFSRRISISKEFRNRTLRPSPLCDQACSASKRCVFRRRLQSLWGVFKCVLYGIFVCSGREGVKKKFFLVVKVKKVNGLWGEKYVVSPALRLGLGVCNFHRRLQPSLAEPFLVFFL